MFLEEVQLYLKKIIRLFEKYISHKFINNKSHRNAHILKLLIHVRKNLENSVAQSKFAHMKPIFQ